VGLLHGGDDVAIEVFNDIIEATNVREGCVDAGRVDDFLGDEIFKSTVRLDGAADYFAQGFLSFFSLIVY